MPGDSIKTGQGQIKRRGDWLKDLKDSFERVVSCLIDAPTIDELNASEQEVHRRISVVTEVAYICQGK